MHQSHLMEFTRFRSRCVFGAAPIACFATTASRCHEISNPIRCADMSEQKTTVLVVLENAPKRLTRMAFWSSKSADIAYHRGSQGSDLHFATSFLSPVPKTQLRTSIEIGHVKKHVKDQHRPTQPNSCPSFENLSSQTQVCSLVIF